MDILADTTTVGLLPPVASRLLVSTLSSQLTDSLSQLLLSAHWQQDWTGLFNSLRSPSLGETTSANARHVTKDATKKSVETALRSWGKRTCASMADLVGVLRRLNVEDGCSLLQNYLTGKFIHSSDLCELVCSV